MRFSRLRIYLFCAVYILNGPPGPAQAQERPKIGLVLSGGGAKGFAHIGVLKVIEEIGLPIDYITGTSIGSILGGLYAVGYNARDLEEIALYTDWNEMFTDEVGRRALGMEQKMWDGRYIASLPIRNKKVQLPSGLIAGQKISQKLARLTLPVHGVDNFADLPIPFACVATDIVSGKAVVLKEGFLPDAIRASMALPSIFTPIKIGKHLLVDGGLVRNFPVEDVKNYGADIVIGVDVSAPLHQEEELKSFVNILDQAISIMSVNSTLQQRQLCDVLILPDVKDMTMLNFNEIDTLFARGESAARNMLPQLLAIKDSLAQFTFQWQAPQKHLPDSVYIVNIRIAGLTNVSRKLILSELGLHSPGWCQLDELEAAIARVYSAQLFERVTYQIKPVKTGAVLHLKVIEKSEHLFRFGLRFDSRNETTLLLNTVFRNLVRKGSFLNLDLKLGEQIGFDSQYFFHLGLRPRFGFRARLNYFEELLDVFRDARREAQLEVKSAGVEALLGTLFSTQVVAGFGLRSEIFEVSPKIAPPDFPSQQNELLLLLALLWVDTFNRANFPSSGVFLLVRNEFGDNRFGQFSDFSRHLFAFKGALPLHRKLSLLSEIWLGTTKGRELPSHYQFILGGVDSPLVFGETVLTSTSFLGFKSQEFVGPHVQFVQLGLQYEIFSRIFVQLRMNAGNTFAEWNKQITKSRFESGIGITLGALTPLGPLELTLMGGSRHAFLSHFNLGFKF